MTENTDLLILGAGPAGLTAGYYAAKKGGNVHIIEKSQEVGGLAKTLKHGDILYDIGPHILCSREYVYDYNPQMYELIKSLADDELYEFETENHLYRESMVVGPKRYKYPISIFNAVKNVGLIGSIGIGLDYLGSLFKHAPSNTYEEALEASLGKKLANLFLLDMGEKTWGVACNQLSADVAVRAGDFSICDVILKQLKGIAGLFSKKGSPVYYPKKGIGVICERLKEEIESSKNGIISLSTVPQKLVVENNRISSVEIRSLEKDAVVTTFPNSVISTIPVCDLLQIITPAPPENVLTAARNLRSRSLVCVCLVFEAQTILKEHCIYISDPQIPFGRVMEQNHFSKEMVPNGKTLLDIEYCCWFDDNLWKMSDSELAAYTVEWLKKLGIVTEEILVDSFIHREKGAYPVFELGYEKNLGVVKEYIDGISNLHIIGRVGSFSYIGQYKAMQMGWNLSEKILKHN